MTDDKRKISCIALDLDGTALRDDNRISRQTRRAIEDAVRAGISIAMENASPGCKDAADYITKSNREDGVAFAIRHILGIPESRTAE